MVKTFEISIISANNNNNTIQMSTNDHIPILVKRTKKVKGK